MLIVFYCIIIFLVTLILVNVTAVSIMLERKLLAFIQRRVGPSIFGKRGALQTFADILKTFYKRVYIPARLNSQLLSFVLFTAIFIQLCFCELCSFGIQSLLYADSDTIFLLQIALQTIVGFAVFCVGLFSTTLYSILGADRFIISEALSSGSSSLENLILVCIINGLDYDNLFITLGFCGLFFYGFITLLAIFNLFSIAQRAPLDLIEPEGELVAGYNTEYSGSYLILIYFSEYLHLLVSSLDFVSKCCGVWLFESELIFNIFSLYYFINIYYINPINIILTTINIYYIKILAIFFFLENYSLITLLNDSTYMKFAFKQIKNLITHAFINSTPLYFISYSSDVNFYSNFNVYFIVFNALL